MSQCVYTALTPLISRPPAPWSVTWTPSVLWPLRLERSLTTTQEATSRNLHWNYQPNDQRRLPWTMVEGHLCYRLLRSLENLEPWTLITEAMRGPNWSRPWRYDSNSWRVAMRQRSALLLKGHERTWKDHSYGECFKKPGAVLLHAPQDLDATGQLQPADEDCLHQIGPSSLSTVYYFTLPSSKWACAWVHRYSSRWLLQPW